MTLIAFQGGQPILKADGTIGAEQACCCEQLSCSSIFLSFEPILYGGTRFFPCLCDEYEEFVDNVNNDYQIVAAALSNGGFCDVELTLAEGFCVSCDDQPALCAGCGEGATETSFVSLGGIQIKCCCGDGTCDELLDALDEDGNPLPEAIWLRFNGPPGSNSRYIMPCPSCDCPDCNPLP